MIKGKKYPQILLEDEFEKTSIFKKFYKKEPNQSKFRNALLSVCENG